MRIVLACLWAWSLGIAPALAQDFYLKDGDRVVFYGDSITEQRRVHGPRRRVRPLALPVMECRRSSMPASAATPSEEGGPARLTSA